MKKNLTFVLFTLLSFYASANNKTVLSGEKKMPTSLDFQGFEENKGQLTGEDASKVLYFHKDNGFTVFLTPTGIVYQFNQYKKVEQSNPTSSEQKFGNGLELANYEVSTYRMDMTLIGANLSAKVSSYGKSTDYKNYYNYDALGVFSYEKIIYENVYPNIDWVVYKSERGIKYDFIVRPDGDPNQIKFKAKWVEKMHLDSEGNLLLENSLGTVKENKPISFQGERAINTAFVLKNDTLSYSLGKYNKQETLIIDPDLIWGSYYGGESTDAVFALTTDNAGNVYFCGFTSSSTGIAQGGFLNTIPISGGFGSAFLVKFTSSGARVWATYYGGTGYTGAFSCKADSQGNIIIGGTTSDNTGIAFNGFQNTYGGGLGFFDGDGFLAKFDSNGFRLWGTYFGGTDGDSGTGMDIDSLDNIYLTGFTTSSTGIAFNGFQNSLMQSATSQGLDAYLAKFNTNGGLLWATYFGGSSTDESWAVSCANNGDVYIAGRTVSSDLPILNAHQPTPGSPNPIFFNDAFLAKFSATGLFLWSTYYGGLNTDEAWGCATDNLGNVFISGRTNSSNNIFFNGFRNGNDGSFLAKFNASGVRLWGTYYSLGDITGNSEWGFACATDSENNVYLAGRTSNETGIAFQGIQNTYGGSGTDGFVVKFNPLGGRIWGSYYGGNSIDGIRGIHVDAANTLYVGGGTASPNNIFFQGFQSTLQGETGFVAKIGCPEANITNLPAELCAQTSIQVNLFPTGGTLQLQGVGSLQNNIYTAPNVSQITPVTLRYIIPSNGNCPGDTINKNFLIIPNVEPTIQITASKLTICENDSVTFTANISSGGNTPNLSWFLNNVLVAQNTLSYSSSTLTNNDQIFCVLVSSSNCANPDTVQSNVITITVNPVPSVNLLLTNISGFILVSNLGFSSYSWFLNGNLIVGANNSTFIPTSNGLYTVVVSNEFGCTDTASLELVGLVFEEPITDEIIIYPNPGNGNFIIKFGLSLPESIRVTDAIGKVVFQSFGSFSQNENLDLSIFADGPYFITFKIGDESITRKLVIIR